MAKMHATKEAAQKAIIVLVNVKGEVSSISEYMDELTSLCEADEMQVVGTLLQNTNEPSLAYLIGTGKLEELKTLVEEKQANIVVFDNILSGSRLKNLAEFLGVHIIDRNMLILDIFARRAETAEGQLQTELAQLKYMMPRLAGIGSSNNKYGAGGVGMRGPGETKLELDNRRIRDRIHRLQQDLKKTEQARDLKNKNRQSSSTKKVAIIGYTNAGKSTLLNTITKAGVFAKDMLFATLDTTSRFVYLDQNKTIVLSDTVGFVSRLPHEFVEAFKGTLRTATEADLLLVIVDALSKKAYHEFGVVQDVLNSLKADHIKRIVVLNKCEKADSAGLEAKIRENNPNEKIIKISALKNENIDILKKEIENMLF